MWLRVRKNLVERPSSIYFRRSELLITHLFYTTDLLAQVLKKLERKKVHLLESLVAIVFSVVAGVLIAVGLVAFVGAMLVMVGRGACLGKGPLPRRCMVVGRAAR